MSRVGKYPIVLRDGVSASIKDNIVIIKGKKGESSYKFSSDVLLNVEGDKLIINPANNTLIAKKLWGTTRALLNNMVVGVSDGFKVMLDLNGVGFRASVQGKNLVLQLGFSHDVIFPIPADVSILCPDQTHINIEGMDKQRVGQVAAEIRGFKKPEPYKGKGIKYSNEVILRKEGKKK